MKPFGKRWPFMRKCNVQSKTKSALCLLCRIKINEHLVSKFKIMFSENQFYIIISFIKFMKTATIWGNNCNDYFSLTLISFVSITKVISTEHYFQESNGYLDIHCFYHQTIFFLEKTLWMHFHAKLS